MEDHQKKSEDTKAKLLDAAGEVFAERGFRAATVRDICNRAGAPLGAVNYHFRDKQGLYSAVLQHSHQSAMEKYPPDFGLRSGATPEERLRAFIRSFLLRLLSEGVPAWHLKLMAQEILDPTDILDQVVQNLAMPIHTFLVGIISELWGKENAAEAEESDDIFLCAMSIGGQCLHYFTSRRVIAALQPKDFDPADIERIADHITRFSLAGIRQVAEGSSRGTPSL